MALQIDGGEAFGVVRYGLVYKGSRYTIEGSLSRGRVKVGYVGMAVSFLFP